MNCLTLLQSLLYTFESSLEYIDAIHNDEVNTLPPKPAFNRDDVDALIKEIHKHIADASSPVKEETLTLAVMTKVKLNNREEYCDWIAGQKAIARDTGFLMSAIPAGFDPDPDMKAGVAYAFYAYRNDPSQILPTLPPGQKYVWIGEP